METEKNILVAFILNLAFSIFELVGGILTGSVAIISDSVHDIFDAVSIGVSYFLEKKSKRQPDKIYTYGYARFSVLGGMITTALLLLSSVAVIANAVSRIISPIRINYNGMIIFAVFGVLVNFLAAYLTRKGDSVNQKAVSLHMLEDLLGWIVVLVGAVVMKITDLAIIDPLMSIGVAIFILINAVKGLREILELFLEKVPRGIDIDEITEHLSELDGVLDVHHIHIWSTDGQSNYATMHIVADGDTHNVKESVRHELREHGINHVTIELEEKNEPCHERSCSVKFKKSSHGHCHHH